MDKQHIVHATWTTSYTQLYMVAAVVGDYSGSCITLLAQTVGKSVTNKTNPTRRCRTSPLSEDKSGEDHSESITCNSCGTKMQAGTLHCTNCGAQLS